MAKNERKEKIMDYLFKAKTTKIIKIDANNLEQAKRFFFNDYIIVNIKKTKKK